MYESFKSDSKLGELDDQGIALISSKSKWTFADALIRACPWISPSSLTFCDLRRGVPARSV